MEMVWRLRCTHTSSLTWGGEWSTYIVIEVCPHYRGKFSLGRCVFSIEVCLHDISSLRGGPKCRSKPSVWRCVLMVGMYFIVAVYLIVAGPAQLVRLLRPWPYHFLTMTLKKIKMSLFKFMASTKDMITLTKYYYSNSVKCNIGPLIENFVHNFHQTKLQNLIQCSKSP